MSEVAQLNNERDRRSTVAHTAQSGHCPDTFAVRRSGWRIVTRRNHSRRLMSGYAHGLTRPTNLDLWCLEVRDSSDPTLRGLA